MISFAGLTMEEKRFLKENRVLSKKLLKHYREFTRFIGLVRLEVKSAEDTDTDRRFHLVFFLYMLPLLYQYYDSTLRTLSGGHKMAAGCLLRAQVETYIDLTYLMHRQDLADRYLEYKYVIQERVLRSLPKKGRPDKVARNNIHNRLAAFKSKYQIDSDDKVATWSGVSIRVMSKSVDPGGELYSIYSKYSNYLHSSSKAHDVIFLDEGHDDFLHDMFYECYFYGAEFLLSAICDLMEIFQLENSKVWDSYKKETRHLAAKLMKLRNKTDEWESLISRWHGK